MESQILLWKRKTTFTQWQTLILKQLQFKNIIPTFSIVWKVGEAAHSLDLQAVNLNILNMPSKLHHTKRERKGEGGGGNAFSPSLSLDIFIPPSFFFTFLNNVTWHFGLWCFDYRIKNRLILLFCKKYDNNTMYNLIFYIGTYLWVGTMMLAKAKMSVFEWEKNLSIW